MVSVKLASLLTGPYSEVGLCTERIYIGGPTHLPRDVNVTSKCKKERLKPERSIRSSLDVRSYAACLSPSNLVCVLGRHRFSQRSSMSVEWPRRRRSAACCMSRHDTKTLKGSRGKAASLSVHTVKVLYTQVSLLRDLTHALLLARGTCLGLHGKNHV